MSSKKYRQGIYKPTAKGGYCGAKNPRYLSSWELKFFRWCDNNPNVVKWGSETIKIPYVSPVDSKIHNYLVDNLIHLKTHNGVEKYIVEIKPKKQTIPPKPHGNKKRSTMLYEHFTYQINIAKWKAAQEWAKKHRFKFLILTEDHLFSNKNNK